jgi:hypothetical protein
VIKTILKLAIVAIIANATWHAFVPYSAHFKFKDAVESASQYGFEIPDDMLRLKVLEIAAQYDVPLTPEDFTLRRDEKHTIIDGSYTLHIELFPGFKYPYTFKWHTDTFTVQPPKLNDLAPK